MTAQSGSASAYTNRDVLLKKAVHNHSAASREGLLERMFTLMFRGFVYPQIWEDPEVDIEALRITPESRIFTIASGGCNIMNYLTENPASITAVDLNPAHIALTRLKLAAARSIPDYESFFKLFGEADNKRNPEIYDRHIAPHLDAETRAYWDQRSALRGRRIAFFTRNIYRYGLLGRFIGSVHLLAKLYGKNPRDILSAGSIDEQREIFEKTLGPLFDRKMVRALCNMPVSLYGLGIPPSQYDAMDRESNGDMAALLKSRLEKLACDFPITDNYFAWQAFGRGYDRAKRQAVPRYLRQENFARLKDRVSRVSTFHTTITDHLAEQPEGSFDRYVFLDAQDWMNDEQLTALWTQIVRTASPGARVIFRTAGTESPLPGRIPDEILSRFSYDPEYCKRLNDLDRSSIYGGFHLYVLKD